MATNETVAQMRARQKANSLEEQRQRFFKTGRATKGLERAGQAVSGGAYMVKDGDSVFSISRAILGPNATEAMVQAFAKEQFGIRTIRAGDELKYGPTYISPNARVFYDGQTPAPAANASTNVGGVAAPLSNGQVAPVGPNAGFDPNVSRGIPATPSPLVAGYVPSRGLPGPQLAPATDSRVRATGLISTDAQRAQAAGLPTGDVGDRYSNLATQNGVMGPILAAAAGVSDVISGLLGKAPLTQTQASLGSLNLRAQAQSQAQSTAANQQRITQNQQYIAQQQATTTMNQLRNASLGSGAPAQTISPSVAALLQTDLGDAVDSGVYVQTADGGLALDNERWAMAVAMAMAGETATGTGAPNNFPGVARTIGVYDVRRRGRSRSGVNLSGTNDLITEQNLYGLGFGGELPTTWRTGF